MIEFAKRVGIVCGAAIAFWTVASGIAAFAARPFIMESNAWRKADSLQVATLSQVAQRLEALDGKVQVIEKFVTSPEGSRARKRALETLRRDP